MLNFKIALEQVKIFLVVLTFTSSALALPRLGDPLPANPWKEVPARALIVLYSHDCGDLKDTWKVLLNQKMALKLVNPEETPAFAPPGLFVWRGTEATAFSRALKIRHYPTVLYLEDGRINRFWEGDKNDLAMGASLLKFLSSLPVEGTG